MRQKHLPLLHSLDSDPVVMRYLLGRARTPAEIDAFWVPRCADARADAFGLGWWVGFHAETFVGWWDLGRSDSEPDDPVDTDCPEIGWRVRREHWRQGFATEGAAALLDHAFHTLMLPSVWAETMAVNVGSWRVMHKLGMRHVRTYFPRYERPLPGSKQGEVVYAITADEWRHRNGSS